MAGRPEGLVPEADLKVWCRADLKVCTTGFFETGEPVEQALVKAGGEQPLRRDDINRVEARQSRQQIEVGRVQAMRIGDPITDGHDNAAQRARRLRREEEPSKRVLVDGFSGARTSLVRTKRGCQEPGLLQHALGATVEIGVTFETVGEQFFESVDGLSLTTELIVEPYDFGHEPGTNPERRRAVGRRLPCRRRRNRVSLEGAQPPNGTRDRHLQPFIELIARDDIGQQDRSTVGAESPILAGAPQLPRSPACRHDDCRGADEVEVIAEGEVDDGRAEAVKVGDTNEPRPSRRDHWVSGLRSAFWMSSRACAASIIAPAAADDASQARAMSPDKVASRRIDAALFAINAALTSSE